MTMQYKFPDSSSELLTIKEASVWASEFLGKKVTPSNISYLVQYGRIKPCSNNTSSRQIFVNKSDLVEYYESHIGKREIKWKNKLGEDIDWHLSFEYLKEADTTKHVHRLHPYKGKFIPQLVEYFLDEHKDEHKTRVFFRPGNSILDPFCGSGTTLVQSNELGMHAVGIDISHFNALISNVKIQTHDLLALNDQVRKISHLLGEFASQQGIQAFDTELDEKISQYNKEFFPSPEYKRKVIIGEIDEEQHGREKEKDFIQTYRELITKHRVSLVTDDTPSFMNIWFNTLVRGEIEFVKQQIEKVQDERIRNVLQVVLSRTMRSCRATTHSV